MPWWLLCSRDIEIGEVSEKFASMEDKLRQAKDQLRRREYELDQEHWRLQNISSELDKVLTFISYFK